MLKRVLLLILLILWAAPLFAQSVDTAWVRRYNGPGNDWDAARAIVVNNSESIYVTGMSKGSGTDRDYATIKYNFNGDELWVRRYNGPGNYSDQAFAIVADNFGNVYVTGGSESDYVTIKYDSSGNEIWVRRYTPGEVGMAIEVDGSENVYVTGLNHTIKYDAQGNELWTGEWGGPAIALDTSMNIYVAGPGYNFSTGKYYANGDTCWVRMYNGPGDSYIYTRSMAIDNSSNVYVTGLSIYDHVHNGYGTVKYDSSGNFIWAQFLRRIECPGALDITTCGAGYIYVTGGGCYNYTTVKYDQAGNEIWLRIYNCQGQIDFGAQAISVDGSGNVYVTGICQFDYATIKYDSPGNELWIKGYNGIGNSYDVARDLTVDDSGNVYVTGQSIGDGTDWDYATIKYVQFLRADVNKDSIVNIIDVVYLINYIFKSGSAPVPAPIVGDASCDSNIDINDVIYLINYLFKSGLAPCI